MDWNEYHVRFSPHGALTALYRPRDHPALAGKRPKEEVFETLLWHNLSELTGLPGLIPVCRALPGSQEDLVAVDPLGRIHLFEVKNEALTPRAVDQLTHYLLRLLLRAPGDFLEERWSQRSNALGEALFAYSAAALANLRLATSGYGEVCGINVEAFPQPACPRSRHAWLKLKSPERHQLLAHAALSSLPGLSKEELQRTAHDLRGEARARNKAFALQKRPTPGFSVVPPLVIWLVGPTMSGEPTYLQELRAQGVDARVLLLDVRMAPGQTGWVARLKRERLPARDRLERSILKTPPVSPSAARRFLQLSFYQTATPSDAQNPNGGLPLTRPRILFTEDWTGSRT